MAGLISYHEFLQGDVTVNEFLCGCARYIKKGSPKTVMISCNLHNLKWSRCKELPKTKSNHDLKTAVKNSKTLKPRSTFNGRPHSKSDPMHMTEETWKALAKVDGLPWKINIGSTEDISLIRPLDQAQDLCSGGNKASTIPARNPDPITSNNKLYNLRRREINARTLDERWPPKFSSVKNRPRQAKRNYLLSRRSETISENSGAYSILSASSVSSGRPKGTMMRQCWEGFKKDVYYSWRGLKERFGTHKEKGKAEESEPFLPQNLRIEDALWNDYADPRRDL